MNWSPLQFSDGRRQRMSKREVRSRRRLDAVAALGALLAVAVGVTGSASSATIAGGTRARASGNLSADSLGARQGRPSAQGTSRHLARDAAAALRLPLASLHLERRPFALHDDSPRNARDLQARRRRPAPHPPARGDRVERRGSRVGDEQAHGHRAGKAAGPRPAAEGHDSAHDLGRAGSRPDTQLRPPAAGRARRRSGSDISGVAAPEQRATRSRGHRRGHTARRPATSATSSSSA